VDECGVCDGDGTSCSLQLRLLMQLPSTTDITSAASAASGWHASLTSMLQSAYQQAQAAAPTQRQLQVLQLTAGWVRKASKADQLLPTRHLLSVADIAVDKAATPAYNTLCPRHQHSYLSNSLCSTDAEMHAVDLEAGIETAAEASSTRRLQAPPAMGLASGWQAVVVEVSVAMPSTASSSYDITTSGAVGMSVLQLGYALASNLQQQADARQAPVDAESAGLQLQEVLLVQRLGVCGNGLCEVGERALLNAAGEAIKEAAAPCPQVGQQKARTICSTHITAHVF
jgi:hypothetical protein